MSVDYNGIIEKLNKVPTENQRLENFDKAFHEIIKASRYCKDFDLLYDDGSIKIENIKRATDKLGLGTLDFYSSTEGRCTSIPTKDTLMLMAVGLGLDLKDLKTLIVTSGNSIHMKSLKEFIICCGLKNDKSIDEISEKLMQYGYREQSAFMSVEYNNDKKVVVGFRSYFKTLCRKKKLNERDVLEKARLSSPLLEPDKNKYYFNAFCGQKAVKIILDKKQTERLFAAMDLNKDEMLEYTEFLLQSEFIEPVTARGVFNDIRQGKLINLTENIRPKYPRVDMASRGTELFANRLERLKWNEIDEFIQENFSVIRSYAIFYEGVLSANGYNNVAQFCEQFNLSSKSHYNYVAGISLPELARLTAIAFLFRKMTTQIYNTLLKKSGKFSFNDDEDSAVYIVAMELLRCKKSGEMMFGSLYDCVEKLISEDRIIDSSLNELQELFYGLADIIYRNILFYDKENKIPGVYAHSLASIELEHLTYTDYFVSIICKWSSDSVNEILNELEEKFGFHRDSNLLESISRNIALNVEEYNG